MVLPADGAPGWHDTRPAQHNASHQVLQGRDKTGKSTAERRRMGDAQR
jgi:hypothetical protein